MERCSFHEAARCPRGAARLYVAWASPPEWAGPLSVYEAQGPAEGSQRPAVPARVYKTAARRSACGRAKWA
jgi:hypothetical protein